MYIWRINKKNKKLKDKLFNTIYFGYLIYVFAHRSTLLLIAAAYLRWTLFTVAMVKA